MKKHSFIFALLCVVGMLWTSPALALLNKGQSADFARNMSRNASTDLDAGFYNPAALAFLEGNGFHLSFTNQVIFIAQQIQDKSELMLQAGPVESYDVSLTAPFYPCLYLTYKLDDWAFYTNIIPLSGSGGGSYPEGLPQFDALILGYMQSMLTVPESYTRDLMFEGSILNLSYTAGAAYRVNDEFALALGYRLTTSQQSYGGYLSNMVVDFGTGPLTGEQIPQLADATVDVSAEGMAHTFIVGMHSRPIAGLEIGVHLEYSTPLEVTNSSTFTGNPALEDVMADSIFADGKVIKYTEPLIVFLGVSYQFLPKLKVGASAFLTFNSLNDLDGAEENWKDQGYFCFGTEYALLENLDISIGYAYSSPWLKSHARQEVDFSIPTNYVSGGFRYLASKHWSLILGLIQGFPISATNRTSQAPEGGPQTRAKQFTSMAFGVEYHGVP